jgi:hypothetical protein
VSDTPRAYNRWRKGYTDELRREIKKKYGSLRKSWLHSVACCRLVSKYIRHPDCLALIDLVERRADDDSLARAVTNLRRKVNRWAGETPTFAETRDWYTRFSAWAAAEPQPRAPLWGFLNTLRFRDVLAEVYGPRDGVVTLSPSWRTDTAVSLARTMYEERDFSAMPILADALQDAGCNNDAILDHCRDSKQVHVRGCWVVDLVLGLL